MSGWGSRAILALAASGLFSVSQAQAQPPADYSLSREVLTRFDRDKDEVIVPSEVPPRLWEILSKADQDSDKKLTKAELDRSPLRIRFRPANGAGRKPSEFKIPRVQDMTRVGSGKRPTSNEARNSAYILETKAHAPLGEAYVIITDQSSSQALDAVNKLAEFRKGKIIRVDDLAEALTTEESAASLRKQLIEHRAGYVALAPRSESFRENTVLGAWQVLAALDEDPMLDAYPGWMVAPDDESFVKLVENSIAAESLKPDEIRPFAISQVASVAETRSLQKSGVLRLMFQEQEIQTPTVGIYSPGTGQAPVLAGDQFWKLEVESRRNFIKRLPEAAQDQLDRSTLIVMHGHGIPGMSCGLDVVGLPKDMSGKVILCGSCFAAAPIKSDLPAMRSAPGGYEVAQRSTFSSEAIRNGANVFFGHMRLSQGFPHLFPVLEGMLGGKTTGQSYQELINALIKLRGFDSGKLIVREASDARRIPEALLLYVLIGDPAAQPYAQPAEK